MYGVEPTKARADLECRNPLGSKAQQGWGKLLGLDPQSWVPQNQQVWNWTGGGGRLRMLSS